MRKKGEEKSEADVGEVCCCLLLARLKASLCLGFPRVRTDSTANPSQTCARTFPLINSFICSLSVCRPTPGVYGVYMEGS